MKVTIQAGVYTYRVASDAVAVDGIGCYEKRLLNELSLVKSFSTAGTAPLSLSINVRNEDWYIPATVDLWAATVVVEANNGHKWAGKITAYDTDSGGVLYIIATEKTAPELSIQIPDEVARVVTLDEKFHVSALNVTLPYVLGGNIANPILVKGILIDKTQGIYLLAVGENHQFVKVHRGTEELSSGFSAFTGTAGQANYPGICYVQITDESLRKNDDGSYVEISADIVGLKLGSHTIEECRNGARQLLWLLKTAKDGVGGWGLGISESEINLDAFTESISHVDSAGLKSDGIMYFRQEAIGYIDQICKAIRGRYRINADGKRSLFVDAPAASVKTYSPVLKNMKLLRFGKGAYTGRVFNKGRLECGYNPLTSMFMQTVSYQNSTSIAAIEEQEFTGQSYFLRDMASAQAILDYTCKKSQTGAEKVFFEALELPENASDGQIITVDYPEKGISGDYQITHLDITDFIHTIEAERFSTNDFTSGPPGTAINWMKDPPVVSPVLPGVASGLTLSSEVRPSPDGTNIVVIKGSFTPPAGSYIAASIEWGEGILPILSWNDRGMMQGSQFEIAPVKPAQAYAVRIRLVTATGKSSYITGTLTTEGDTVPPGKPAIAATSSLKNVKISLSLGTVPSDMAGFEIYRNTSNNSGSATKVGTISSKTGEAQFVDMAENYGDQYYYWCKAFDTWGNKSVFSDAFGPLTISMILSADVSPEAIKQAIGSVAAWSAKNCTTASIAEASGVIDVSGNANHGQAFGGVAVVASEMGAAFSFGGGTTTKIIGSSYTFTGDLTFSAWIKPASVAAGTRGIIGNGTLSPARKGISLGQDGTALRILVGDGTNTVQHWYSASLAVNTWYMVTFTFNQAEKRLKLYKNGVLIANEVYTEVASLSDALPLNVGAPYSSYNGYTFNGLIADPRAYSRALSETEVKSLYMFPGDVAFGRVTADLVATGTLQALFAQIAEAFIGDAYILNVNAAKILAGYLDVARIANDSLTSNKIIVGREGSALNESPNFEDSTAWASISGTVTFNTVTDGKVGNTVIRATNNSAAWPFMVKSIPLDPAKTYRVRVWVRKSATATGTLYVCWRTFNSAGAAIPANYGNYIVSGATPSTTWTEYNILVGAGTSWVATSDARTMKIGLGLNYGSVIGYAEAQDFRIEEVLPSTLIKDDSITTAKIAAGAVTTTELTSSQIVGKDFRTASNVGSGTSGVKFTSSGIEAWKGTTRTVYIQSNGDAAFAGDISGATGTFSGQVESGPVIIAPTGASSVYGVWGVSTYAGYFSIYVGPLGTVSTGTYAYTKVVVRIGTMSIEVGGSRLIRSAANAWQSDTYVKVLTGYPSVAEATVRFKTSTSGTTGFFIVIGDNNNWGNGYCTVVEAIEAVGSLTLANAAGTTNYTRYGNVVVGQIVAWALFNGIGTVSILASNNISSISDNGVGDYTLNMTKALTTSGYAVTTSESSYNSVPSNVSIVLGVRSDNGTTPTLKTTTQLRLTSGSASNGSAYDNNGMSVVLTV